METLAHRLSWLRSQRDWTLCDVRERTGVSISYLSELERGAIPSLGVMERIARAYDLSLGEALVNVSVLSDEEE